MLYLYIQNVTSPVRGVLTREDGMADYDVAVQINVVQLAFFTIYNHRREDGWAVLLKRIADEAPMAEKCTHVEPKKSKRPCAKCQPEAYKVWRFRMSSGYNEALPGSVEQRIRSER